MSDSTQTTSVLENAQEHISHWLQHEPEMDMVLVFTGATRQRAMLWGAILDEWLEAVFDRSDVGVAQARLSWWGETLTTEASHSPHPLAQAFALETDGRVPATHWHAVTQAAMALSALDDSPADVAALIQSRLPLAQALADVEVSLWPETGHTNTTVLACNLVLWQWRHAVPERTPQPAWWPLQLLARYGLRVQDAAAQLGQPQTQGLFPALAEELLAVMEAPLAGSRFRRIRARLDRQILRQLQAGQSSPFRIRPWRLLWQSWQAARGAVA